MFMYALLLTQFSAWEALYRRGYPQCFASSLFFLFFIFLSFIRYIILVDFHFLFEAHKSYFQIFLSSFIFLKIGAWEALYRRGYPQCLHMNISSYSYIMYMHYV